MYVSSLIEEYYKAVSDIKKNNKIQIPTYRIKYSIISSGVFSIAIILLVCFIGNGTTTTRFISSTAILAILIVFSETVVRRINVLDEMDYCGSKSLKKRQQDLQSLIIVDLKKTLCRYHIDYENCEQMNLLMNEISKEKEGKTSAGSTPKILKVTATLFIVPAFFIIINKYITEYQLGLKEVVELVSILSCIIMVAAAVISIIVSTYEMIIRPWITKKEDRLLMDLNTLLIFYRTMD